MTMGRLLREIGRGTGLSSDLRNDASRFASLMRRKMDRRDVERVAWLLWNVSSARPTHPRNESKRAIGQPFSRAECNPDARNSGNRTL